MLVRSCRCFFDAKRYLLAPVSSGRQPWRPHTACERCLRSWTSHLEIQSMLSLKATSSRTLYGCMAYELKDTVLSEIECMQQSAETSERHENIRESFMSARYDDDCSQTSRLHLVALS
jgi:hypothetical protein